MLPKAFVTTHGAPPDKESGSSRVVSFRLSKAEYQELQSKCNAMQIGSVAELARLLMREFIRVGGDPMSFSVITTLRRIEDELNELSHQIHVVYEREKQQQMTNPVGQQDNSES